MAVVSKNASFYLKRVNDQSREFLKAVNELKSEALSRRIVTTTLDQLFKSLKCTTSKEEYESAPSSNVSALISLLAHYKLRLIPLSLPTDLAYEDPIFVTIEPEITNDEDIAYVTNLVKAGRTPKQSDLPYITRMNEKMANYNIMLRVFEALFVICRGPLGPHQRMYVNNLLGEIALPQEGRAFLRACYTYVSTYPCHRCEYGKGSLKDLDANKTLRICQILSEIYARGGTAEPIDPSYPHVKILHEQCIKTFVPVTERDFFFAEEVFPSNNENLSMSEALRLSRNHNDAYINSATSALGRMPTGTSVRTSPVYTRSKNIAIGENAEQKASENKALQVTLQKLNQNTKLHAQIVEIMGNFLEYHATTFPSQLPDFALLKFCRIKATKDRSANFFFLTSDVSLASMWPSVLCSNKSPSQALSEQDPSAKLLRAALANSGTGSNAEFKIFSWNYFLALIVLPLYAPDEDRTQYVLESLKENIYKSNNDLLQQIYVLHRILFCKADVLNDSKDELFVSSLVKIKEYLNLYIFNAYLQAQNKNAFKQDLQSLAEMIVVKEVANVRGNKKKIAQYIWQRNRAVQRATELIEGIKLPEIEVKKIATQEKKHNFKASSSKLPAFIMMHVLLRPLLTPLFCTKELSTQLGLVLDCHEHDPNAFRCYQLIYDHLSELCYLADVPEGTPDTLADLITDHCTKEEILRLRNALSGRQISDLEQLRDFLNFSSSPHALSCLGQALDRCGIVLAPMPDMLPDKLKRMFREKTLVALPLDLAHDEDFKNKLKYAQLCLILCRTVSQGTGIVGALADQISTDSLKRETAVLFLKILDDLCRTLAQLPESFYEFIYLLLSEKEDYKFFGQCLKKAVEAAINTSVFKAYESSRLSQILQYLHLQDEDDGKNSRQRKQSAFDTLDTSIINSKLKESREVESVISLLREDEEEQNDDHSDVKSKFTEQTTAPKIEDLISDTIAQDKDANLSDSDIPENIKALATAVAAQKTDCMDEHEFNGLCLSMGFMSKDVAIEEINDYCYEHFDEPLFESAPEEGSVYITQDLLDKITQ